MSRVKTLQSLFKRYRRPGDIVFAWVILIAAVFLLSQLTQQTSFKTSGKLVAQPRFWPGVSLSLMVVCAVLHLIGSLLSERLAGRWKEVLLWFSAIEYALWFVAYAAVVPVVGYLPTTVIVAVLLVLRVGYRSRVAICSAALTAVAIVLLFKTFLQVKVPAGQIYEYLPDGIRQIMLTYF